MNMGSLHELLVKVKPFYTLILLLILGSIFMAFWQFSVLEGKHVPIKIEYKNQVSNGIQSTSLAAGELTNSGTVIGSKTGKKYYYPWCGTVKRIKEENQVTFASIAEARSSGYLPGGNCKGLK